MAGSLGELFVELGVIGDSKEIKAFGNAVKKAAKTIEDYEKKINKSQEAGNKLNNGLGAIVKGLVGITAAIGTAYYALDRLTDSLVKQNLEWLNLTRQSDIALSTFQKWGTIGKIVGVNNAAQQLENLNQKIFNLRLTGEGAKGFQMAGIMPTNAEDVLEQLRTRIQGMSNTSATYLLQQMGLDPKMITLLRMGREEWEEYLRIQEKFTLTKEQRENIDKMNRQLEVARVKMQYFRDTITLSLMPAFVKLTQALAYIIGKFAKFIEWIEKGESPASQLTKALLGIAAAIGVIKAALWALNAHPIIATITLITGAIMALWKAIELVADDINHYINGGGSVIGVIAKGLEDLDLKGRLDFPVPKWLDLLIKAIDFFRGGGKFAREAFEEDRIKEQFGQNVQKIRQKDGSVSYAEIPPELLGSAMSSQAKSDIRNSNTTNNKTNNTSITMKNEFYTNQPAQDTAKELRFLQQQFGY